MIAKCIIVTSITLQMTFPVDAHNSSRKDRQDSSFGAGQWKRMVDNNNQGA